MKARRPQRRCKNHVHAPTMNANFAEAYAQLRASHIGNARTVLIAEWRKIAEKAPLAAIKTGSGMHYQL